ncbi:Hypothetical predicted protein [Paramuricea clavata]|uniref:Uncharacterized protein n=1 Tax=Paramuricea clavata TaxID=317549 RepID=A0A7D9HXL2_PARCT|nr:Hypothetical predicted protein [Paramuricea clavata]
MYVFLLYNSEVYVKNDFNNWDKLPIEKVHFRFCKLYLGVGKKASNIASRGELGKFPLIINIFKRLFKYITHLNSLSETAIAKQAFLISKDLFTKQNTSYYRKAMDILKAFNLNTEITDLESITTELIQPITKRLKENYLTFWKHKLENSSKLTFYSTIKIDYEVEKYLSIIKDSNKRKTLTRFRLSNHSLQIETGRYHNIAREERLCNLCHSGEVENESHLLLTCEAYGDTRVNFINSLKNDLTTTETNLNEPTLSVDIMKSTASNTTLKLSKFIFSCFEERLKQLEAGNAGSH